MVNGLMTHQDDHCVAEATENVLTGENGHTVEGAEFSMNKGLGNENVLMKHQEDHCVDEAPDEKLTIENDRTVLGKKLAMDRGGTGRMG